MQYTEHEIEGFINLLRDKKIPFYKTDDVNDALMKYSGLSWVIKYVRSKALFKLSLVKDFDLMEEIGSYYVPTVDNVTDLANNLYAFMQEKEMDYRAVVSQKHNPQLPMIYDGVNARYSMFYIVKQLIQYQAFERWNISKLKIEGDIIIFSCITNKRYTIVIRRFPNSFKCRIFNDLPGTATPPQKIADVPFTAIFSTIDEFLGNSRVVQTKILDICGIQYPMAEVEAGYFIMGNNDFDSPAHFVEMPSTFYVGIEPVSTELWNAVMRGIYSERTPFISNKEPITRVAYPDVITFIQQAVSDVKVPLRLPFECEWEYAAQGGRWSHGYKYAGSNNLSEVTIRKDEAETLQEAYIRGIETKKKNELGLVGMTGYMWEWTHSTDSEYSQCPEILPITLDGLSDQRMLRGGTFIYDTGFENANRGMHTLFPYDDVGFRLVLDPDMSL